MTERFRTGPNPALIPVLLAMTQNQDNFEKTLDDFIQLIQSTKNAMNAMRSGMETFQAGMMKIALPQGGQPAGPPANKPKEAYTKPVEEEKPVE
ncbi:MAG: hypothetical protein ACOY46_04105 [Bacillota bacterium]